MPRSNQSKPRLKQRSSEFVIFWVRVGHFRGSLISADIISSHL
jgi:hypothetical protein